MPGRMSFISQKASNLISVVLLSLLAFTLLFTFKHWESVFMVNENVSEYSFVGKDYPLDLPISLPFVDTVFEESMEFIIEGLDARRAWRTIHPKGRGYVHLGPKRRFFALATFHQLHCLVAFQTVLSDPDDPIYSAEHIHHCLNYVRQIILCNADSTLEPYDFMSRNFTANPMGFTRRCRDWKRLYDFVTANHAEWLDFIRSNHTKPETTWWGDKLNPND